MDRWFSIQIGLIQLKLFNIYVACCSLISRAIFRQTPDYSQKNHLNSSKHHKFHLNILFSFQWKAGDPESLCEPISKIDHIFSSLMQFNLLPLFLNRISIISLRLFYLPLFCLSYRRGIWKPNEAIITLNHRDGIAPAIWVIRTWSFSDRHSNSK